MPCVAKTKLTEKREKAPALQMEFSTRPIILGDSGKIKEKLQGSALPWTVAGSTETILYFVGANELI